MKMNLRIAGQLAFPTADVAVFGWLAGCAVEDVGVWAG